MPSASPSPIKRPSLTERNSSTHSLSSSGRQTTFHKVGAHRQHAVGRHNRNSSHGKGLSKLGKVQSTASITSTTDNQKSHQRKKSGGTTPPHSPRAPLVKRNSSHVALAKNTSFGNLRKNHSSTGLPRNVSHGALKKIGLAPTVLQKSKEAKDGVFQLGDRSSDEEEEGEWEDSATQSPEMTRNNSKTSTPARAHTPSSNGEQAPQQHPAHDITRAQRTSSPPLPSLRNNNRSAPDLKNKPVISQTQHPPDPALLQHYTRSSRAPPAMSTVSAHVGPSQIGRSDSSRSFSHLAHTDAAALNGNQKTAVKPTPALSGSVSVPVLASSSVEGGVSHFLSTDTPASSFRQAVLDDSDGDSPSNFLSNYRPQPSESPEKTKTLHKARLSQMQSRTQQKLDLQKREISRAGPATPATPLAPGMPSATSLHSRAASRNRNRSLAGEIKAVKKDYDSAVKQLMVVRRFRSPMLESLGRLKEKSTLPQDVGNVASRNRPQSRRGPSAPNVNGQPRAGASRSFEEQRSSPLTSRSNSRGRGGRVHFQRQRSHDDIEVTPSQPDGTDGAQDDEQDLIRRIWDSREVYDSGEHGQA